MKNNFFVQEVATSAVLVALLILILNPLYMPDSFSMMLMFALVAVFVLFASFVWKERARDEREILHRLFADRAAFLAGTAFLVIALIVQIVRHDVDPLLVVALALMIIAKAIGSIRAQLKH